MIQVAKRPVLFRSQKKQFFREKTPWPELFTRPTQVPVPLDGSVNLLWSEPIILTLGERTATVTEQQL